MSDLDLAQWGSSGNWIWRDAQECSPPEQEPLCEVKHAANAANLANDHNALVAEVARLRTALDRVTQLCDDEDAVAGGRGAGALTTDEVRAAIEGGDNR